MTALPRLLAQGSRLGRGASLDEVGEQFEAADLVAPPQDGANLHAVSRSSDRNGSTPLQLARARHFPTMVRFLESRGA